jgi:hypothetical protein
LRERIMQRVEGSPAARIAEALRALRTDGDAGSFAIFDAGDDYVQVSTDRHAAEIHVEAARGAWYTGQPPTLKDSAALRAEGFQPPPVDAEHHNFVAEFVAQPELIDGLAARIWKVLSTVFGHDAASLRVTLTLEDGPEER